MTIGIRTPMSWTPMVVFLKRLLLCCLQAKVSGTQIGHKIEKLKTLNTKTKYVGIRTPESNTIHVANHSDYGKGVCFFKRCLVMQFCVRSFSIIPVDIAVNCCTKFFFGSKFCSLQFFFFHGCQSYGWSLRVPVKAAGGNASPQRLRAL
jgi:hypothetical protein